MAFKLPNPDPMLSDPVQLARMNDGRQTRMWLQNKSVKLAAVDEFGKPVMKNGGLRVGSGFLIRHETGLHLYTCWHVVTGLEWLDPVLPPASAQRTFFLDMTLRHATGKGQPIQGIGAPSTVRLPLYKSTQIPWLPLWQQPRARRSCPKIEGNGLRAPRFDVVRLKVPEEEFFVSEALQVFAEGDIWRDLVAPGDTLRILGFPYGFSGLDQTVQGLMLTRFAAQVGMSVQIDGPFLDRPCTPGMSGGPVLLEMGGHVFVAGIYTGERYPDGVKREKTTALGTYCPIAHLLCSPFEEFESYPAPA